MKKKWEKGHVGRFWNDDFKQLEFIKQPITQVEINEWVSKGYDYVKSFSGSMYDNRNPMPEWVKRFTTVVSQTEYKDMTFCFYKMKTLEIMPEHVDHFRTYMKITGAQYEDVCRMLVMLEDWKPGHYLEIDGTAITDWIAGDYFIWDSNVPHAAANIGVDDRYTLQITMTKIKPNDYLNLHWYNIPNEPTLQRSTSSLMLESLKVTERSADPTIIYTFNSHIKPLEKMEHDKTTVTQLNEKGLNIYLTEPLCSYLYGSVQREPPFGTIHNMWWYSEFNKDVDIHKLRAEELDSIVTYIKNNDLTNVTVYTCDYDVDKYYPYYKTYMKLSYKDLFVRTVPMTALLNLEPRNEFTRKFMCLNWRYTSHRHLIAAMVLPKSALGTWYYRADLETIHKDDWYNVFEWMHNERFKPMFDSVVAGINYLNKNAPMEIDMGIGKAVNITHKYFMDYFPSPGTIYDAMNNRDIDKKLLEEKFQDIFCDIVTESRFAQPTGNYSEKVYHPIRYMKPFVLVSSPKSLQALKEQGFKTFSDFWDESYDDEFDHNERLLKIFNVIEFIDSKTIEELRDMYAQMQSILEHNYNLLNTTILPEQGITWKN